MIGASTSTPYSDVFDSGNGLSMNSALGYGFHVQNDKFLVTPYVESKTTGNMKTLRLGADLQQMINSSRNVGLNLFVGRSESSYNGSENEFGVQAELRF